ncbi:hypothetical protein [Streptomyces sp. NPDC017524]|uniref:hypothetical protein n=1 Tax=unclassified Streptomyces TaxID=2593676 RepID=UPI0037B961E1
MSTASAPRPRATQRPHVGDEWLHLTLYRLSARPADAVTESERQALTTELTSRMRTVALVDVVADDTGKTITWKTWETAPLSG